MAEESRVKIEFEDTGEVWTKIEDFSIRESWFEPSDTWSATVYDYESVPARELRRRFHPKRRVRIYFGDRLQMIGSIERTADVGNGSTALQISGNDYLFPLTKGGIDPQIRIITSMTLEQALLEGLRAYGITKIETTIDAVRSAKMGPVSYETKQLKTVAGVAADNLNQVGFGAGQSGVLGYFGNIEYKSPSADEIAEAKPHEGESVHEWASRLSARSAYTIQPGSSRNSIAVVRPDYAAKIAYDFSRPGNVQDAMTDRDWENVPTYVAMRSRRVTAEQDAKGDSISMSPVGESDDIALWSIEECRRILAAAGAKPDRIPKGKDGDPNRLYVPVYYRDDDARTDEKLRNGARRFTAEHLRETLKYSVTLKGWDYKPTGATYAINNLAKCSDEVSDVDEVLWIAERNMTYSGGESTQLSLIRPASYVP